MGDLQQLTEPRKDTGKTSAADGSSSTAPVRPAGATHPPPSGTGAGITATKPPPITGTPPPTGSTATPPPASKPNASARLDQGIALCQRGEYGPAIVEFTAALTINPTLVRALVLRGDAHRMKGDYALALADYSRAIDQEPANVLVRLNRGQVYGLLNQPAEAIADYTAVLEKDAKNALAYTNRGKANAAAGNLREDRMVRDSGELLISKRLLKSLHAAVNQHAGAKGPSVVLSFRRLWSDHTLKALEVSRIGAEVVNGQNFLKNAVPAMCRGERYPALVRPYGLWHYGLACSHRLCLHRITRIIEDPGAAN